jgi:signal transduction histidine kinase
MEFKDQPIKRNRLFLGLLIFFIVLSVALIVYLFERNHKNYRETITNQWRQQLLTTTRISAVNLESYFNEYSKNLTVVSNDPVVQSRSCRQQNPFFDKNYCPLFNLYNAHKKDIDAIILLDSNGVIVVRFPKFREGKDVTGEHCPHDISRERKLKPSQVIISDVFLNKANIPAITISCPVFYKGKFSGVLRWMITIDRISKKYVDSIRIGRNGSMIILDNLGIVRARGDKSKIGINIYDSLERLKSLTVKAKVPKYSLENIDFFDKVKSKEEGSGSCYGITSNSYNLAVFKKVEVGNNLWTLVTTIPYNEITSPIIKNAIVNYISSAVISMLIIVFSVLYYRTRRKKEKLEIESKYLNEIADSAEELRMERQKRITAMIDGQEIERSRVSRELHDSLGQYLLTIKIKIEELLSLSDKSIKSRLENIRDLSLKTIEETKQISYNLMPVMIEELGLITTLENLCRDLSATGKPKIDFVSFGVPENLDLRCQTYLYRITQEALSNLIKHANATEANVQLLGNNEQVTLIIQDDGMGFDPSDLINMKGNGLNNIRERSTILNGVFHIDSKTGQGTTIQVKIPVKGNDHI